MGHTRQTQVLEVHSQSLPSPTLHPHHPHTIGIRPQSFSLPHNVDPSKPYQHAHTQSQSHGITHPEESEWSVVCHTRQTQEHKVQSQSLPPPTLHPHHRHKTHVTPHSPTLSLTHNVTPSQHHYQHIHTSTTIAQYHSLQRVRVVSCAPHPADTSA